MRITKTSSGTRRPRIQFYLTEELDRLLTENRDFAKKHGLSIEFQDAFRLWFLKENKDAKAQLSKLTDKKTKDGDTTTD